MMEVGTKVKLKLALLGNPAGARGVCTEVYDLDGRKGYYCIFANGDFDGFSPDDVKGMLDIGETLPLEYRQTSVLQLMRDFKDGKFKRHLEA